MQRRHTLVIFCTCLAITVAAHGDDLQAYRIRWIRKDINFQTDGAVKELLKLIPRAKSAGYNGIILNDSKFARVCEKRQPQYFANVKRTRALAKENGIQLIPCVMPVTYSSSILSCNPNPCRGNPSPRV